MGSGKKTDSWLRLSEAADYLGVHFTTLRRWADEGDVPCIRTPGGRRRFQKRDLKRFLNGLRQKEHALSTTPHKGMDRTHFVEQVKHQGIRGRSWYDQLDESQRSQMRTNGRKLIALLMQYIGRSDERGHFLEEGQRLASQYGQICREVGFSLLDTVKAFISIRRSIIDSLYEAGMLIDTPDQQTWQLYQRVDNFLDAVLLAILSSFQGQPQDSSHQPMSAV